MQAACTWVTPVNKPRIMIDYFDAGIGNIDTSGPAAMVRPVRPWPYQFLREKKWRRFDSN